MTLKILVIDDEPAMTTLISLLLKSYGMEVVTANQGEPGIQLVHSESPDVVMLDLMMPDMSGIEVCQAIRAFSNVPLLAYSALNDREEIAKALAAGINDHLEKPAPSEVLVQHIQQLVKS
jgi:two-component system, OmpR family, response regulator MtrA